MVTQRSSTRKITEESAQSLLTKIEYLDNKLNDRLDTVMKEIKDQGQNAIRITEMVSQVNLNAQISSNSLGYLTQRVEKAENIMGNMQNWRYEQQEWMTDQIKDLSKTIEKQIDALQVNDRNDIINSKQLILTAIVSFTCVIAGSLLTHFFH